MNLVQAVGLIAASGVLVTVANAFIVNPRRQRQRADVDTDSVFVETAKALVQPLRSELDQAWADTREARREAREARDALDGLHEEVRLLRQEVAQLRAISGQRTEEVNTLVDGVGLLIEQVTGLGVDPVWHLPVRFLNRLRPPPAKEEES